MNSTPELPHATANAAGASECAKCRASDKSHRILLCGDCYVVGYCSKQCQLAHWKAHKSICAASRPDSHTSQYHDPIAKLTERVDAARFQQSRPRVFSAFISTQDVINAAERTYRDALREATTLLTCEPQYRKDLVGDQVWVGARLEWMDECEKVLGKSQAALQTLNMFQKRLEVPPILIGFDGPFVGQSKKAIRAPDAALLEVGSTYSWDSEPCTRCRKNHLPCQGKQGRACISCKKQKVSCNFSSIRPSARPKGRSSSKSHSTRSSTPGNVALSCTNEIPTTSTSPLAITSQVIASSSSDIGMFNNNLLLPEATGSRDSNVSIAGPSDSAQISSLATESIEVPSLPLKRKRSVELWFSSNPIMPPLPSSSLEPIASTTIVQSGNAQCDRCWATGKVCQGPMGRPCIHCKKVKLGCSLSTVKHTTASFPASAVPARTIEACYRCKQEDRSCVGPEGLACNACKKSKTKCSLATGHQLKRNSSPPPFSSSASLASLEPEASTSGSGSVSNISHVKSNSGTRLAFQAEFAEPCNGCKAQGTSCWGLKESKDSAGVDRPKQGASCWRCLEANTACSNKHLPALTVLGYDLKGKAKAADSTTALWLSDGLMPPFRPQPVAGSSSKQVNTTSFDSSILWRHFAPTWDVVAARSTKTPIRSPKTPKLAAATQETCKACKTTGETCFGPTGLSCSGCRQSKLQCSLVTPPKLTTAPAVSGSQSGPASTSDLGSNGTISKPYRVATGGDHSGKETMLSEPLHSQAEVLKDGTTIPRLERGLITPYLFGASAAPKPDSDLAFESIFNRTAWLGIPSGYDLING